MMAVFGSNPRSNILAWVDSCRNPINDRRWIGILVSSTKNWFLLTWWLLFWKLRKEKEMVFQILLAGRFATIGEWKQFTLFIFPCLTKKKGWVSKKSIPTWETGSLYSKLQILKTLINTAKLMMGRPIYGENSIKGMDLRAVLLKPFFYLKGQIFHHWCFAADNEGNLIDVDKKNWEKLQVVDLLFLVKKKATEEKKERVSPR